MLLNHRGVVRRTALAKAVMDMYRAKAWALFAQPTWDGGVKVDNIAEIAAAGADTFVSGSGIFGRARDDDPNRYDSILREMRGELDKAGN